jgi:hypothetical protein
MNPSDTPDARPTRAELAAQLCGELIRLRDALVSLSINLKDWQFEMDLNGKTASQKIVSEVLNKCRLQRPNEVNPGEISRTPVSKGQP